MLLAVDSVWARYWESYRTRILQAGALALLVVARPSHSNAVFWLGFLVAIAGEAIRFWATGQVHAAQTLSREGPYAMNRHPLYFGSFVIACGFALICTSRRHWLATALVWAALWAVSFLYGEKIDNEEAALSRRFGAQWEEYRRRVPLFWPDRAACRQAWETSDWKLKRTLANHEQRTLWVLLGLALFLRFKMVYL